MYLIVNIIGLLVFLLIGWLFSKDRKKIDWPAIAIMVALNLLMAFFLVKVPWGRDIVKGLASGFSTLIEVAYQGIAFCIPSMVHLHGSMDFFVSVLLPILLIVPLFDTLTYIGFLPWVIKWVGKILAFITRQPKFESFFAVEMMFLGNTEALAVSTLQLKQMKAQRNLTLAMMSMSCVTASILGSYMQMMPAQFILTAVPINVVNALIVTAMLNPVDVSEAEDTIATMNGTAAKESGDIEADGKKEPFFSFLGDSILGAGRLVLIIAANVITFVALAALIDKILSLVHIWSMEKILGYILYPFAWLLGVGSHPETVLHLSQYMGTKLITNEFVVMGKVSPIIHTFAPHFRAVLTVFLTSFANLSTLGMIIGCFKGIVSREKNDLISKNVGYMLLSGILVSLLSAAMVGLFVW